MGIKQRSQGLTFENKRSIIEMISGFSTWCLLSTIVAGFKENTLGDYCSLFPTKNQ